MKSFSTLTIICSYILIGLFPLNAMGQLPMMHNLQDKKNPNFHEVQQAFNNQWKGKLIGGKIPKGQGYKPFKRWEWFWEPRVGKEGNFPSPSVVMEEWEKYLLSHPEVNKPSLKRNSLSPNDPLKNKDSGGEATSTPALQNTTGAWNPLGPSSSFGGYSGVGRLNCITFHPTDANTFWVGSPSGGIWKTTTGGTSWTSLGDNLPVIGVSAIVIDPTNPDIMYIATGDRDGGNT
ncbi:MAG: hypothetical protein M3142_14960, partial [Bacteroidota bacterium]|nr:hypothetical protein [Bacteroidota bacterium]